MSRPLYFTALCFLWFNLPLGAEEQHWRFDSKNLLRLIPSSSVTLGEGVKGKSVVFDGGNLLKVSESKWPNAGTPEFTLTGWVNPYLNNGSQQMIACKNQYSLGQRAHTMDQNC